MKTNTKISCKLIGSKSDGFTLKLTNPKDNFIFSENFTEDELKEIATVIIKKLK